MSRGKLRQGMFIGGIVLLLGAVLATLAVAQQIYVEVGPIKTSFSASIKPRALSRTERAPVAIRLFAKVESKDQAHIPAMTGATIGIDKSLTIDARGIPVCVPGQIENQSTEGAEGACGAALVGSGSATAEIDLGGGSAPIRTGTTLLAFNGGTVGRTTTVLVHAYLTTPAVQSLVVPVALTKVSKGGYGLRALVTIPKIASGGGSLARLDLTFRKRVRTTGGAMRGYLLARCSDGNFVFEPEVEFADGNLARGTLAEGCKRSRD